MNLAPTAPGEEEFVPARLFLQTGECFSGFSPPGQTGPVFGETVFTTGMTGYPESLTDPSYAGQILVFCWPLIGNYGVPAPAHWESDRIQVRGVVISSLARHYSSHTAERSLLAWLREASIPLLTGVDTRAVTKRLRNKGVIPGALSTDLQPPAHFEVFAEQHFVPQVSISEPVCLGTGEKTLVVVDCGLKENILRHLAGFPLRIKRVPWDYDFTDEPFDGVFVSNGPGDPVHCQATIQILAKAMQKKKPLFGICLGTQLLALAAGAKTRKLAFGHRSQNQPCMDLETGRCYLTAQNHSYVVDEDSLPPDWKVLFRNLNDQSIEGIAHCSLPFFAVQFHPESAPGPRDTEWLFQKFYTLISQQ